MTAITAPAKAPTQARRLSPLGGLRNTFTLTWRSVLKIRTNMEDVFAITIGFGMILGFRVATNPAVAVAGVLLLIAFALAMCWVSALIGMLVKTPQGVQAFGFIAFFPLVFGSNLFAPTATMPGWLRAFVKVNPITVLTEAERGLFTGGAVAVPAVRSLLWALGIFVVFAPLAVRVYHRKT